MRGLVLKILDGYAKRAMLYDIILAGMACIFSQFIRKKLNIKFELLQSDIFGIITDLISASISLSGFILAALTIIVTFKDNVDGKNQNLSEQEKKKLSGIELFFTSNKYKEVVSVFFGASLILFLCFLILTLIKIFWTLIPIKFHAHVCLFFLIIVSLTIFRSLYVLYIIIKLQIKRIENKEPKL